MRYFKLSLAGPEGKLLFEREFTVNQFAPFVQSLATAMVQQKIMGADEKYQARLLPQAEGVPVFDKPVVLSSVQTADEGEGDLDILFENLEPPVEAVKYLTVQIRAPKANLIYRFDLPLESLLEGLITQVVQSLLDNNTLADGDRFKLTISAHQKDLPFLAPAEISKPKTQAAPKVSLAPVRIRNKEKLPFVPPPEAIQIEVKEDDLDIVIGPIEELVKPIAKSIRDYGKVEQVGVPTEQDLLVYMHRGAMEQAHKAGQVSTKSDEEVGGFLLGHVFCDPDINRLFIEISDVVETNQADGTYGSLHFNHDSMGHLAQVLERVQRDFPDKAVVGWYHTHLVSLALAAPVEGSEREYTACYRTFFSHADLFVHRNFFPDPWHVGLVLDLRRQGEAFFAWQAGEIIPTQGYYLFGE